MSEGILFIPSTRRGDGTGHLRRALRLAGRTAALRSTEIFVPPEAREAAEYLQPRLPRGVALLREDPPVASRDILVVDRRQTSPAEWERYSRWGTLIGLDEGGPLRDRFAYLIDTLPTLGGGSPANRASTGLLELPPRLRERPEQITRILISFGGEDPAGLTESCVAALLRAGFRAEQLTVVLGPLFGERSLPAGVRLEEAPESLWELLPEHDLVCSSFGLTVFEAAAAGNLLLLVNPTDYHRRLSERVGLPHAGVGQVDERRLSAALRDPAALAAAAERNCPPAEEQPLESLLLSLHSPALRGCPVCGRRDNGSLEREAERSFFTCGACGTVYQIDFGERGVRYGEQYFFEEYRRQYGRSYLEDAAHIRALSAPRVRLLRRLLGQPRHQSRPQSRPLPRSRPQFQPRPRLLDVGCAYGPFLQTAEEQGFQPEGTDISAAAAEYVREELGYPVWTGPFEEFPHPAEAGEAAPAGGRQSGEQPLTAEGSPAEGYDAVTMWFVIEHFADLDRVLKRVSALLRPGGVFAFSTPNLRGGSGRFGRRRFLHGSPYDHFSIWYPRMARRVLKRYGLQVVRMRSTGHHPERLPGGGGAMGPLRRRVLDLLSRAAGLGDTFEVYARKTGEPR